jgi:sulfoxide reductase catalytic subunit YedY
MLHGAPLRLHGENEVGFKWASGLQPSNSCTIFLILARVKEGCNEDHEFFGYRVPI